MIVAPHNIGNVIAGAKVPGCRGATVRQVMARPMATVEESVPLQEIYRLLLAGNQAVVVMKEGRLAGLIARSDLMEYYKNFAHKE
jgi:predicted transcriptional regulator